MSELDERKAAILRAIVEHYVDSAQPVGSQTVTQSAGLGVSAATVRNEMSVLERDGFIVQPHTSAGRVPTDLGYRYYVDHLAGAGALPAAERRRIVEFFTSSTMAMDDLLHETSQLLARVTAHAAVVVGPEPESVTVRSAHLVLLQPRVLLAVVIMSNGAVEKETVVLTSDADPVDVGDAGGRLAAYLDGHRLAEIPALSFHARPGDRADALAGATRDVFAARVEMHHGEPLYVGGAGHLAADQESFGTTSASGLLDLLEQHVVLASLLRELLGPGLTVHIGAENERADLRECSIVLAPYLVEGEPLGTIGVLGPTRMDYRKAQAAVSTVSRRLGQQLSR
jgi:heat-inducible transcriptional repressor